MRPGTVVTADDLVDLPDDGFTYELHRGALVREPLASYGHGVLASRLFKLLANHVDAHGLGQVVGSDTGFILFRDPDTVLAPDVAFLSCGRIESAGAVEGFWPSAPDLAVEVVAPSNTRPAMERKARMYLEAGARLVWVLDPKRGTATVYVPDDEPRMLDEDACLDGAGVVPGFTCRLKDLFAGVS